jgi:tRNA threonylcarbamoyladenosine biosynthesis protein TsaB
MILFLDTTFNVNIGLIDDELNFLDFNTYQSQKASTVVHGLINEMLLKHQVSIQDLDKLIFMAGPGSYTGMRVGGGIADIFENEGIKTLSLYHYEIPKLSKTNAEGCYISKAFKGEYFLYDIKKEESSLIKTDDLSFDDNLTYYHNSDDVVELLNNYNLKSTLELLLENSQSIVSKVIENEVKRRIYYYRKLEVEFKVAK